MDAQEARELLGVGEHASWADVRRAYRVRIRATHPDVSAQTDAPADAALVTQAYATLEREQANAGAGPGAAAPTAAGGSGNDDLGKVSLIGDDTILVPVPAEEAFALLLDAAHRLGAVSFIDRSSGFLEAIVTIVGGPACSVVVSLQGRAIGGTEAFVTIEPLGQGPAPAVGPFTAALAAGVAQRWPG